MCRFFLQNIFFPLTRTITNPTNVTPSTLTLTSFLSSFSTFSFFLRCHRCTSSSLQSHHLLTVNLSASLHSTLLFFSLFVVVASQLPADAALLHSSYFTPTPLYEKQSIKRVSPPRPSCILFYCCSTHLGCHLADILVIPTAFVSFLTIWHLN